MYIQNLPSMVVPHVLDPQEGERVLDMCASPGGKTTHVAALMKGTGQVISLDRTEAKVAIIRQWAVELGLPNIQCFKADSTLLVPYDESVQLELGVEGEADAADATGEGKKKRKKKGAGGGGEGGQGGGGGAVKEPFRLEEASFDRIVLDPPCTAYAQPQQSACPQSCACSPARLPSRTGLLRRTVPANLARKWVPNEFHLSAYRTIDALSPCGRLGLRPRLAIDRTAGSCRPGPAPERQGSGGLEYMTPEDSMAAYTPFEL